LAQKQYVTEHTRFPFLAPIGAGAAPGQTKTCLLSVIGMTLFITHLESTDLLNLNVNSRVGVGPVPAVKVSRNSQCGGARSKQ